MVAQRRSCVRTVFKPRQVDVRFDALAGCVVLRDGFVCIEALQLQKRCLNTLMKICQPRRKVIFVATLFKSNPEPRIQPQSVIQPLNGSKRNLILYNAEEKIWI